MKPINTFIGVLILLIAACTSQQEDSLKTSDSAADFYSERQLTDTVWASNKNEYDIGRLVNSKRIGLWLHQYLNDTTIWEERYFTDDERIVRARKFYQNKLKLEENYLSDGVFSISYYDNGCINNMGYHRTIDGHEGEQDGLWLIYDSLGNLHSETYYDFAHDKITYREYENTTHLLQKECTYFQEGGESTCYKNGIWKYYKNGKQERTQKHQMEATLNAFGM